MERLLFVPIPGPSASGVVEAPLTKRDREALFIAGALAGLEVLERGAPVAVHRFPFIKPSWGGEAWTRPPKVDSPRTTAAVTALEATLDGRARHSWMPESGETSHRFEPVEIEWSTLPPVLAAAFGRLADALALPRVIGSAHYTDRRGRSVEERLERLARAYKAWAWSGAKAGALALEASRIARLIERAKVPATAPELAPARVLTSEERAEAHALLERHVGRYEDDDARAEVYSAAWDELENPSERCDLDERGDFPGDVRRAFWRAEARRRERRRRERLRGVCPGDQELLPLSLGGKVATGIVDAPIVDARGVASAA